MRRLPFTFAVLTMIGATAAFGHPCVCGQRERTDNGTATAKAVAGEHCGREADFSTALLAKAQAASVEMTVPK
jgi:hypothetical protein